MAATPKLIKWQAPMQRVLYALIPLIAVSIYLYGWRVLVVLALANTVAFLTEYAFARVYREPVTSAIFVTGSLFALALPPALPLPMVTLGAVCGVVFGKMVFGGFGRNIFNPALVGRAFIYVSFGDYMTSQWSDPVGGFPGGLGVFASDAITKATPGMVLKLGQRLPLVDLLFGNTSGTMGATCAVLVVICGSYLVWKKAANYRIVVSGLVGMLICQGTLYAFSVQGATEPFSTILSGSFLFGLFFFATEPVSSCKTNQGRWIYGAFIGILSSLITVFSRWPAGTMFAILLANTFAPITDLAVKSLKARA